MPSSKSSRCFKCSLSTFTFILYLMIILSCNSTPYVHGKRLYIAIFQNFHMEDGSGLASLIPPLKNSDYLGKAEIACILINGIKDTIFRDSEYLPREMPSFKTLSATEVTNIVNYINHSWYDQFKETTILQIVAVLDTCLVN